MTDKEYTLIPPQEEIPLPKKYHTKDCDHWQVFSNPVLIPEQRKIMADLALTKAAMCIKRETLVDYFKEIRRLLDKGQIVTAFSWFQEIENRINDLPLEEHLIELACVYSILPGENPDKFQAEFQKKKREIFESDSDAKGFFLRLAYTIINGLSTLCEANILTLIQLAENRHKEAVSRLKKDSETSI